MATVPRYDTQVAPQAGALPTFQAPSPDAFNVASASATSFQKGVNEAVSEANKIAIDMRRRDLLTKVTAAENQVIEEQLNFAAKLPTEYVGANASKSIEDYNKAQEEWNRKAVEALGEDTAAVAAFQKRAEATRLSGLKSVMSHQVRAVADHEDTVYKSGIELGVQQSLSTSPLKREAPDLEKQRLIAMVEDRGVARKWDADTLAVEKTRVLTAVHGQRLQALVKDNPLGAQTYFDTWKDEIDPTKRDEIGKMLQTSTSAAKAEFAVEDALKASNGDYTQALTVLREKLTGEDEKHATDYLAHRQSQDEAVRKAKQTKINDDAWKIAIDQGQGLVGLRKHYPDIYNSMSPSMSNSIRSEIRSMQDQARQGASGSNVKTDSETYYNLRKMAVDDPAKFKSTDLRTYFPKLSPSDREEFIKLQTGSPTELKDVVSLDKQLTNTHNLLGWGAKEAEKKGAFDRAVADEIASEQERTGKKLGQEERQKIIDRLLIERDDWFGSTRYFEVRGTPKEADFLADIKVPKGERAKIEDTLKRNKMPVTDAAVMQLYKRKMGIN